jgi:predicted RNase H-like nuclease (RuvC/YqgF family)
MSNRCASIRQEDLAEALKAAVDLEQQRIQNISKSDLEAVAGGQVYTQPVIIVGTDPGTTVGMFPTGDGGFPTGTNSSSF